MIIISKYEIYNLTAFILIYNVPGGIRTHGLPLRRRTLYPAELQAPKHNVFILLFPTALVNT